MAKGYWIAHASVTDPEAWSRYVAAAKSAFEAHGARFLARGGAFEEMEGSTGHARHVLIEFPSLDAARACWHSAEYQAGRAERVAAGTISVTLVEGVD